MKTGTTRIEIFSDGVIAIAITIMVIELKASEFTLNNSQNGFLYSLLELMPHLIAYVFSFLMIGIFWINHHHLFYLLEKADNYLLGLNLFFLFWISLIPFVTENIGASPLLPVSSAIYGFVMLMISLSLSWIRSYTLKNDLIHSDNEKSIHNKIFNISLKEKRQSYIGSAIYLLSILVAFVNVYLSYLCFIIPVILFLIPKGIDEESLANKVIEKKE